MKLVYGIQLFTSTYKLDGLVNHRTDRKGGTTTGITIQLGQYYTIEIKSFIEFFGGVYSILTGHRIHYEQNFVRIDGLLNSGNLVHHFFVYSQAPGGIDDYKIIAFGFGFLDGILGNDYRIFAVRFRVHRYVNLFSQYA